LFLVSSFCTAEISEHFKFRIIAMSYNGQSFLPDLSSPSMNPRKHQVDPKGYKIVSVRLREAEFEVFSQQVSAIGLTNNMALRIAARRIGGFLEIDSELRERLEDISRKIGFISHHLGALKAGYAQSGKVDMEEFTRQRAGFDYEFQQLDGLLRSILNVSRRRLDGRLMLKGAVAEMLQSGAQKGT
jgi:type IV secretion system T-DNA border endonuclease VirD1